LPIRGLIEEIQNQESNRKGVRLQGLKLTKSEATLKKKIDDHLKVQMHKSETKDQDESDAKLLV
jgi:hypothetical protein